MHWNYSCSHTIIRWLLDLAPHAQFARANTHSIITLNIQNSYGLNKELLALALQAPQPVMLEAAGHLFAEGGWRLCKVAVALTLLLQLGPVSAENPGCCCSHWPACTLFSMAVAQFL